LQRIGQEPFKRAANAQRSPAPSHAAHENSNA